MKKILYLLLLFPNVIISQIDQMNYRNWEVSTNANDKIALVIGNSAYQYSGQLSEPANDAAVIKSALEFQGFDVLVAFNLDRANMFKVIKEFSDKFKNYKSGIVFYAGHGFQIDGENYLIPVDANLESSWEVQSQCMNVETIFKSINDTSKPKVVILDACRNNPFSRSWNASDRSGLADGMSAIRAKENSLIIFSTAEGTKVKDDNPFTEILSKYIKKGGCIYPILGKVSKEVRSQNRDQVIWQAGILESDVCFGGSSVPFPVSSDSDGDGVLDSSDQCPYEHGPISNNGCPEISTGDFTDSRDGQTYTWKKMKDGKKWMTENLNYEATDSWCYGNVSKNCLEYGRLYTWAAAKNSCPAGWHLPSDKEWFNMVKHYGGCDVSDGGTDSYEALILGGSSGFSALLGGWRTYFDNVGYFSLGNSGTYWSDTESSEKIAWFYYFEMSALQRGHYLKMIGRSCRCIED